MRKRVIGSRRGFLLGIGLFIFIISWTGLHKDAAGPGGPEARAGGPPMIFASFAETASDLRSIEIAVESIRSFAGRHNEAPVWVYLTETLRNEEPQAVGEITALDTEVKKSRAPEEAAWYYLSRKVFASAQAEEEAAGKTGILAWLDVDTVFLQEPAEFILPAGKNFGFRPVMHKNISPLFAEPLDAFWNRAYALMEVPESRVFPMVTVADGDTIRPYFNAGCLVVRPERGLLGKWAEIFCLLSRDSVLKEMCRRDERKRLFIHQVALAGAVMKHLSREETVELSDKVNFPVFFKEMFGAKKDFRDIRGVISIRHEQFYRTAPPGWDKRLVGPPDKIAWLKARFESPMKLK